MSYYPFILFYEGGIQNLCLVKLNRFKNCCKLIQTVNHGKEMHDTSGQYKQMPDSMSVF